jgi:uncharacterized phage-associated protein
MHLAIDVANYFIRKGLEERRPLTPIQIMKLIYYSHGYSLSLLDEPLVHDDVQAWKFGPVFKDVYHTLKRYGNKPVIEEITQPYYFFDDDIFTEGQRDILNTIYEELGSLDGLTLSDLTHQEDTPWYKVWKDNSKSRKNLPIENHEIRSYFDKLIAE